MSTKAKPLAIDLLRLDGETQNRLCIDGDVVEDYAAIIEVANPDWPFPPLDVFHDGELYFVADGFHRKLGGDQAKRGSIPCIIHEGTAEDAHIWGMTANDKHGLRMSHGDKRTCVEWLLDNRPKMTQATIAETAGVTTRWVRKIVADRKPQWTPPATSGGATSGGENRNSSATLMGGTEASPPPPDAPPSDKMICPNCHGTDFDEDGDCVECHEPEVASGKKPGKKITVTEPTGSHTAKGQIQIWADTIGRWLGQTPSIDEYRAKFPGAQGDKVVKAATGLFEALKKWQKGIK